MVAALVAALVVALVAALVAVALVAVALVAVALVAAVGACGGRLRASPRWAAHWEQAVASLA